MSDHFIFGITFSLFASAALRYTNIIYYVHFFTDVNMFVNAKSVSVFVDVVFSFRCEWHLTVYTSSGNAAYLL